MNEIKKNQDKRLSPVIGFLYFLLVFLIISFLVVYCMMFIPKKTRFMHESGPIINPLMGWAPWATAKEIFQPHSLVYADLTWREFEPQMGHYDFASFEEDNRLERWREKDVRVVFRFVMDVPGDKAHLDIPDWLYEETGGNGDHYAVEYGEGYSPDYSDPVLIEAHRKAILALGKKYGQDDFIAYIQLGSLGHWGEWHVKYDGNIRRLPDQDIRDIYVAHYLEAFPKTHLLLRRPFTIAKEARLGLYNDMTGDPKATNRWLEWIENGGAYSQTNEADALAPMPDGWQVAPIGGEQTGSISDEELYGDSLKRTMALLTASHTTFIGPGGPYDIPNHDALQNGLEEVLSTIGYRLYVDELQMPARVLPWTRLTGRLSISNIGIAPFYYPWTLWFYVIDDEGEIMASSSSGATVMGILPERSSVFSFSLPVDQLEEGVYSLGIGIIDPLTGKPGVNFAMENTRDDSIQVLGEFKIQSLRDVLGDLLKRK